MLAAPLSPLNIPGVSEEAGELAKRSGFDIINLLTPILKSPAEAMIFNYDLFRHRTAPRTFANLTYRRDSYIATATVRPSSWVAGFQKRPAGPSATADRASL